MFFSATETRLQSELSMVIVVSCLDLPCIASRCIDDEERAIGKQGGLQLGIQGREATRKVGITWVRPSQYP